MWKVAFLHFIILIFNFYAIDFGSFTCILSHGTRFYWGLWQHGEHRICTNIFLNHTYYQHIVSMLPVDYQYTFNNILLINQIILSKFFYNFLQ